MPRIISSWVAGCLHIISFSPFVWSGTLFFRRMGLQTAAPSPSESSRIVVLSVPTSPWVARSLRNRFFGHATCGYRCQPVGRDPVSWRVNALIQPSPSRQNCGPTFKQGYRLRKRLFLRRSPSRTRPDMENPDLSLPALVRELSGLKLPTHTHAAAQSPVSARCLLWPHAT